MRDDDKNHRNTRPPTAITVGGAVDRFRITLAFHGPDLEPSAVSQALHCEPTHAHRAGDARSGRSARLGPWKRGAWLYSIEGAAPAKIESVLANLLDRLPEDDNMWESLTRRYRAELGLGLFLEAWNRGFGLPAPLLARIARLGLHMDFDIYSSVTPDDRGQG